MVTPVHPFFLLSGPSGVGKNAVLTKVMERFPELRKARTYSTRAPRLGELEAGMKHFVSREEFDRLLAEDFFLEHAEIAGQQYGTARQELLDLLAEHPAIADLDFHGAEQLRASFPPGLLVTIFIKPSSLEELAARLDARGPLPPAERAMRLGRFAEELAASASYDYAIVNANGKLDEAVEAVCKIIQERLIQAPSAS